MATAVAYPCADAHGFSEHDLTDMLSFFEKEHDNSLLNQQVDPPGETSLDGSSDAAPKQEQSGTSSPVLVAPSYCGMIAPQIQRTFTGHSLLLGHNGAVLGVVPHPASEYSMGLQQAMPNSAAGKDSKLTVSHSTIEKQRRDRINSLIDELRELVPSFGVIKGPDGADMKRPKHVVLSDTISLLKQLKERAAKDQQELRELKQVLISGGSPTAAAAAAHAAANAAGAAAAADSTSAGSAHSLLQRSVSGPPQVPAAPAVAAAAAAASNGPAACPELPQAPANLPASVGVLVEEGDGCFLVKVNCKDRHGLLSDITGAIKGLPLQITRAAITTSNGGAVFDVFEIVVEPDAELEGVTALDIQFQVHQALHKARTARRINSSPRAEPPADGDKDACNEAKRRRSE